MHSVGKQIFVKVFLPLLLGYFIYLIWGQEDIFIVSKSLKFDALFQLKSALFRVPIPDLVIYQLPDALWLFSFLHLLKIIWVDENYEKLILLIGLFLALGHEFGQYFQVFSGTFDWLDVAFYTLASFLFVKTIKY